MRHLLFCALALAAYAEDPGVAPSYRAKHDFALSADPDSPGWKGVHGVFAEKGPRGEDAAGHRTEIRSRWSDKNLYLLYICPYRKLHLKPEPSTTQETNKLWEWDVAEVFIGTDFKNIRHYKELQVSPQGEWVDLDINRDNPLPDGGWRWNSGFTVKARLDEARKIWYGEFRIPFESLDIRSPKKGNELRINFYRLQGPLEDKTHVAWRPTGQPSYHVPEAFGRLRLQ